jgi:hypothetical protein
MQQRIYKKENKMLPQLHITKSQNLSEEIIIPIRNRTPMNKPHGGLWTSTYNSEYGSDWIRWCKSENFSDHFDGFILYPKGDAKILIVDTVEDLRNIFGQYMVKDNPMAHMMPAIDFEAISKDYDAMSITEEGQWRTRFSHPYNMYGWDCESTVWFNWCFDKVEKYKHKVMVDE